MLHGPATESLGRLAVTRRCPTGGLGAGEDPAPRHTIGTEGLLRRLKYLRDGEIVGDAVLAGVFCWLWATSEGDVGWALRLAALFPLCYVLGQGSLYWHLKLRSVSERAPLPAWFHALFRFFKRSNALALGAPLAALVVAAYLGGPSGADVAWSAGLLAFAALEHVNYYARQLMHDNANDLAYLWKHRRLRRAPLA